MKRLEVDPVRLFASRRCLTAQRVVVGDRRDMAEIVPGQHPSPLPIAFALLQTNLAELAPFNGRLVPFVSFFSATL